MCAAVAAAALLAWAAPNAWAQGADPDLEAERGQVTEAPPLLEGKAYRIVFQGNQGLSEGQLRKAAIDEFTDFDRLGQRQSDADDAAFQMEAEYRKNGYAFATVDYLFERSDGQVAVTFEIQEGQRVAVERIDLAGNSAFSTEELLPFFEGPKKGLLGSGTLPFVQSEVAGATSSVRDYYYGHGYLDAALDAPQISFSEDRAQVTVAVQIHEGIQYRVEALEFRGDLLAEAETSLEEARQELLGKPYFRRRRLLLRGTIAEIYGNLGYPSVQAEISANLEKETGKVELDAFIASGPLVIISEIQVEGIEKTRESFVRNRVALRPGDRYDLDKRRKSFRELYKTGLFSKVVLALEDAAEGDTSVLKVQLEEAPSKEFYVEPGWGSYELLRLSTGFREKNVFGTGRIAGVDGKVSIKAQGVSPSLTDPWFLGSDVTATLQVFYHRREEPSFTRRDLGLSLLFTKKLTEHLTTTGGYTFRTTEISDVVEQEEEDDDQYDFASVKAQLTYDTRDDLFFPTRGQRSFFAYEHADDLLGGDLTFERLTGGMRWFFRLVQGTVLGLRYNTGLIIPGRDETTLPLAEKFFNGGENKVRSFKESELGPLDDSRDPVGGLGFNIATVELRQRLVGNLIGSVFFDYGNVSPNRSRSEQGKSPYESRSDVLSDTLGEYFQDFRPAVGFGLNYLTPVGPARFDFAFNPDVDDDRKEDFFRFHFAVGMAF